MSGYGGGGRGPPSARGGGGYGGGGRGGGDYGGRGRGDFGGRGGGGGRSSSAPGRMRSEQATQDMQRTLKMAAPLNQNGRTMPNGQVLRPNVGKVGEKVRVLANHYKVDLANQHQGIWVYDVAISRIRREGEKERPPRRPVPEGPPPLPEKNIAHAILCQCAQAHKWPLAMWSYDGQKLLFTVGEFLPHVQHDFEVEVFERAEGAQRSSTMYKVTTQPVGVRNIDELRSFLPGSQMPDRDLPREVLQAMDVAFRHIASTTEGNRVVGRGIYNRQGCARLGLGTEGWHGYTQSLSLTQSGLTLSIDKSIVAMPCQERFIHVVAQIVVPQARSWEQASQMLKTRALNGGEIQRVNEYIKNKSVTVNVIHRATGRQRYTIYSLTDKPAAHCSFQLQDGTTTTVAAYFQQKYGKPLDFPNLPCAMVSRSSKRPDWIPVELCVVVPGGGRRKLDGAETAEMIKHAAVKPDARERAIKDILKKANLANNATVKKFGMQLAPSASGEPQMMECQGRVLPSPRLEYGEGTHLDPGMKGDWNIANVPFHKPATIRSIAFVVYMPQSKMVDPNSGRNILDGFIKQFMGAMAEKGMRIELKGTGKPPIVWKTREMTAGEAIQRATEACSRDLLCPVQLVVVIQEFENQDYIHIKYEADSVQGVVTQCIVAKNFDLSIHSEGRATGRKLAGLALKINTKLNGENWKISGTTADWAPFLGPKGAPSPVASRVMMLGADVTHAKMLPSDAFAGTSKANPNMGSRDIMPSIAALVASVNKDCTRYCARIMQQEPNQEEITALAMPVHELLQTWAKFNGWAGPNARPQPNGQPLPNATLGPNFLPEVIIMFRDGQSEGSFATVMATELAAIRAACTRIHERYKPRITFISVQKRHGTRLFAHPGDHNSGDGKTGNVRPGLVVDTAICSPTNFDFYLNHHAGIQGTNKPAKYTVLHDDCEMTADSVQLLAHWLSFTFMRCSRTVSYAPPAYYAHHAAFRARCLMRKDDDRHGATTATSATSGTAASTWSMATVHPNLMDTMYFI